MKKATTRNGATAAVAGGAKATGVKAKKARTRSPVNSSASVAATVHDPAPVPSSGEDVIDVMDVDPVDSETAAVGTVTGKKAVKTRGSTAKKRPVPTVSAGNGVAGGLGGAVIKVDDVRRGPGGRALWRPPFKARNRNNKKGKFSFAEMLNIRLNLAMHKIKHDVPLSKPFPDLLKACHEKTVGFGDLLCRLEPVRKK
ncbi:hypothetical protein HK101_007061, partial [Irineochytrium annulatum]